MSQTTSSWKQWVSLFFVWLFLYSLAFINGLWPFIKFAESEATLQCLSKLWSLIHSSEQNWNSFCLGLIDVKTPCQEYPDSQKHNPPQSQPLLQSGPLQILIDLGLRNDTETVMRVQSWVSRNNKQHSFAKRCNNRVWGKLDTRSKTIIKIPLSSC